ncbi:MAG TPA: TldD/PmbA family protein [candidate division WOR-3 bacterium]|uniref:TldD/PmbA family protein n=1 Tax=candidate division WOR-3 bacterium TaxID=2052148 RepID=A0A7C5M4B9_UNCW3|nr:TldD/PmbA family protein [candidate division WOR-3 bacterium]
MKGFAVTIQNLLKQPGVDYGDVRVVHIVEENIVIKNGKIEDIRREENLGFGIRVMINGAWGFASSSNLTIVSADKAIKNAVAAAKAASLTGIKTEFHKEEAYIEKYVAPFEKDPFHIGVEEKIKLLLKLDELLKDKHVIKRHSHLNFKRLHQVFASTEGSVIEQEFIDSGGGISVITMKNGEIQTRSFSNYGRRGFEFIEELDLVQKAQQIKEQGIQLLYAPLCPEGTMDVILDTDQMALQIHESIGHALELDRVLGYEASYAGTSFATLDKLDSFQYGSEIMNVYQDTTYPGGLGTFAFDDEGVRAKKEVLIQEGILRGYLSSRDTAPHIGRKSSGASRAQDWSRIPIVRMTNINLEPGVSSLEEMIQETKEGIFLQTNKSWSIDDKRLNFQFGTEIGWLIKNGKIKGLCKNPVYTGITPQFWRSLVKIGNRNEFKMWGILNCGKGEPGQTMRVGHGSPPCKFKNIKVFPGK